MILLDAGVDPEAENNMLETAHKLAVRAGAKKLAALLDGSYSPDEENSPEGQEKIAAGGMTLHQAVRKGDEEAVRALAAMGENLNEISEQETFEGLSPLAVACQTCNIQMASLLLELGADPAQKNGVGEQPIVALFGPQIMLHTPRNLYRDRLAEQLVALLAQYGFDRSVQYKAGSQYTANKSVTLYAVWSKNSSKPQYFDCNIQISCINGKIVNLYNNPGDSEPVTYFSKGQSMTSRYGAKLNDNSTWYRVTVNSSGTIKDVWMKYESEKMTIDRRHRHCHG